MNEKRQLAEQCEKIVKEMDEKHLNSIRTIEERHKIEIKRSQEKYATAEKTRRDRWIDLKTKKIKVSLIYFQFLNEKTNLRLWLLILVSCACRN